MVSFVTTVMRQSVTLRWSCRVVVCTPAAADRRVPCRIGVDGLFRCPGDWMVVIVEWLLVGGVNEIRVVRCWVLIKSRRPGCLRDLLTQHSGEY